MPRVCTVCTSPDRPAIDKALVAGDPFRYVSERFDVSVAALFRHKTDHLPATLVKAHQADEVAQADDLLAQARDLQYRALGILDKAEEAGDLRTALGGIREARACLELLAELEGRLSRQPVNLLVAPEWLEVRVQILAALQPFPEARQAVAEAIRERAS